jgi:hypothetical protein
MHRPDVHPDVRERDTDNENCTSRIAGTDPEAMTLEAVQAELGAYRPGNAAEVVSVEEWMARRMQLWRRQRQLKGQPIKWQGKTTQNSGAISEA